MAIISFYIARSEWMELSFVAGARAAGYTCIVHRASFSWSHKRFDVAGRLQVKIDMEAYLNSLRQLSPSQKPDLLFFCTSDDNLHGPSLEGISTLGIPMVQYHPDMGFLWFRILRFAKYFDIIACAQQQHMSFLQKMGFRVCWLPFGAIPTVLNKLQSFTFDGVRYLGSPFPDRGAILGELHRAGIPIEIWGHNWDWFPREQQDTQVSVTKAGFNLPRFSTKQAVDVRYYLWPRLRREPFFLLKKLLAEGKKKWSSPAYFDVEAFYGHIPPACIKGRYNSSQFAGLVQSAAINIGFSHMYPASYLADTRYRQMRLRDMEIPMFGGFYMAEYSPDLAACFQDGRHVVFWKTFEELLEKVAFYLPKPELRHKIALAGQLHALANHSWAHRFEQLFSLLSK